MKIREIGEDERLRFNAFVAGFPTADLMQSYEWGEIKSRSGGWKPVRLVGEDDSGEIVASASILFRSLSVAGKSIAYVARGPVIDAGDASLFTSFAAGMRKAAARRGAILLKIDPPIPVEDDESASNILSAGFKSVSDPSGFGGTQPKCVMQLDLNLSEDDLLANFKSKTRYNIRLAEKKGVVVKADCTKDDLRCFYDLLEITAKRDGFLVRDYSYFETIWDALAPSGAVKLFLAIHDGIALSGALDFVIGDRAWYVYGASSNERRNLMPNYLMQWEMIKWAKAIGCKWYDFRGVSPRRGADESDDRLQGLNRFKDGFAPRYVEYIGEYDMPVNPLWYWLWVRVKPTATAILKARARSKSEE